MTENKSPQKRAEQIISKDSEEKIYVLKNDIYRKRRGGFAQLYDIMCMVCNTRIILYQKDAHGNLFRCYLDRIFEPPEFAALQYDSRIKSPKDMPPFKCRKCDSGLGSPMLYTNLGEHRLAYRLRLDYIFKIKSKAKVRAK